MRVFPEDSPHHAPILAARVALANSAINEAVLPTTDPLRANHSPLANGVLWEGNLPIFSSRLPSHRMTRHLHLTPRDDSFHPADRSQRL